MATTSPSTTPSLSSVDISRLKRYMEQHCSADEGARSKTHKRMSTTLSRASWDQVGKAAQDATYAIPVSSGNGTNGSHMPFSTTSSNTAQAKASLSDPNATSQTATPAVIPYSVASTPVIKNSGQQMAQRMQELYKDRRAFDQYVQQDTRIPFTASPLFMPPTLAVSSSSPAKKDDAQPFKVKNTILKPVDPDNAGASFPLKLALALQKPTAKARAMKTRSAALAALAEKEENLKTAQAEYQKALNEVRGSENHPKLKKTARILIGITGKALKVALVTGAVVVAGSYLLNGVCQSALSSTSVCQATQESTGEVVKAATALAAAVASVGVKAFEAIKGHFSAPAPKSGVFGIGHLGL